MLEPPSFPLYARSLVHDYSLAKIQLPPGTESGPSPAHREAFGEGTNAGPWDKPKCQLRRCVPLPTRGPPDNSGLITANDTHSSL